MIVTESIEGIDGEVIIALYDSVPYGGWMLYFTDIKRATIISKFYRVHHSVDELLSEAATYLSDIAHSEGWILNVYVSAAGVHEGRLLNLYPLLKTTEKTCRLIDREVLDYLFKSAPQKKLRLDGSASATQKRRNQPLYEATEPGKVVVTADASFIGAGWDSAVESAGGTGWVIGYHDTSSQPQIILGSCGYRADALSHGGGSLAMEMIAIRDAMKALTAHREIYGHAEKIIVYSDNDSCITSIQRRALRSEDDEVMRCILAAADYLSQLGISVEFRWTKGHANNEWNNIAHTMAALGRTGKYPTDDDVNAAVQRLQSADMI